jgi:hypothetical protein
MGKKRKNSNFWTELRKKKQLDDTEQLMLKWRNETDLDYIGNVNLDYINQMKLQDNHPAIFDHLREAVDKTMEDANKHVQKVMQHMTNKGVDVPLGRRFAKEFGLAEREIRQAEEEQWQRMKAKKGIM